jgi:hypothetical protein
MNLDNEETDLEVVKKPNVIPGRNNVVKTLDRISKEDGIISLLLRGSQESLSNATKPNVTQSAENPEDLRSDQNSKPREAVKRQRAEPVDPTKPNVTQSAGDPHVLRINHPDSFLSKCHASSSSTGPSPTIDSILEQAKKTIVMVLLTTQNIAQ